MKKNKIIIVLFLAMIVINIVNNIDMPSKLKDSYCNDTEKWPKIMIKEDYEGLVKENINLYIDRGYDASTYFNNYSFDGDYLNYGINKHYYVNDSLIFDDNNVPKVKYGDGWYYNPVTVAQYALTEYGKFVRGDENAKGTFLEAVKMLLILQDADGAFRYNFKWRYYLSEEPYEEGWVSAMAQGQVLSVLSRAYVMTEDERYLDAGKRTFDFMITPIKDGGTLTTLEDFHPSLNNYIFFEEYISNPNSYTLNGYMFAVLGLYDWVKVNKVIGNEEDIYNEYFESSMKSLVKVLPYYDIGGFSAYDLGHYTYSKEPHIGNSYHMVHISLLHALYYVTEEPMLKFYEQSWSSYVYDYEKNY